MAVAGAPTPTTEAIASVVADLRAATAARRAVASSHGQGSAEYAAALDAEAAERHDVVARAQAAA